MTRGMTISLCLRNTSADSSGVMECHKSAFREAMCVKANIEARSRNHSGRGKVISVT
jgi:hypothetical protein